MKARALLLAVLALCSALASAQEILNLNRPAIGVLQPRNGGLGTVPGTTAPASCTVGQMFFDLDSTAGQNLYCCTATNTWTVCSGGGSGDVTAAATFGVDNRVIRSDGAGKGVQGSGITVDDTANVSGIANLAGTGAISGFTNLTTRGAVTSGGVFGYDGTNALTGAAVGVGLPVVGGGVGAAPGAGTRSGNTTAYVTTTGVQTSGRCVEIDANGNHIAAAAACGSGGGSWGPTLLLRTTSGIAACPADTLENSAASVTLPALSANDAIEVNAIWTTTGNANVKTVRLRMDGVAGTQLSTNTLNGAVGGQQFYKIQNRNATNSQLILGFGMTHAGTVTRENSSTTSAIQTNTGAVVLHMTCQKATGTDTMQLESIEIIRWSNGS